jgi:hypothetical protein
MARDHEHQPITITEADAGLSRAARNGMVRLRLLPAAADGAVGQAPRSRADAERGRRLFAPPRQHHLPTSASKALPGPLTIEKLDRYRFAK